MPALLHTITVDWDASGASETSTTVYTDDGSVARFLGLAGTTVVVPDLGEDVTARVLLEPGVTVERGRSQIAEQSPPLANEVACALDNHAGDYDQSNAASPLFPNVALGRDLRYRVTHLGTPYPLARGYLTEIAPHPEFGAESVGLLALSQLARLVGRTGYSSPLYGDGTQAGGVRTSVALGYVLDAAGLTDPTLRSFDAGDTILNWFVIRPTDELFDLAIRVWASEGAGSRLYDSATGVTTFKKRSAEAVETRSTVAQATYRDGDNGADPWYAGWDPGSGVQNIVNACSIAHVRRAVDAADAVFWAFGATVTLGASEARPFQVQPTTDDPIASVVALAAGTDYTVSAGSLASAVFDRTSGPFVTVTLTAGAGGATLTGLQVRGKLARVSATTQVTDQGVDTSASRTQYGPHPLTLPTLGELDYLVAQSICNGYVSRGMLPRPTRTIDVPIASDAQATATLPREVGDRVAVVNARTSFAQSMWVEAVRVAVGGTGGLHLFLGCETVYETGYARWDGPGVWSTGKWGV